MRRLILIATVATLAVAKPGMYREKEDFQYSRSSTDEGSKSGFYGAQRGNMGGNYERAHNMDGLAQHQMSGLVKQTQGELGDGSQTRSGSVFTAANSRGVYGSGHFDLSNLEGRNFQEGVSYGDSQQSQSSAYNAQSSQAGYNAQSSQAGYNAQSSQAGYNAQSSQSAYNAQSSALNSAAYRRAQNSRQQNGYNGYNGYQYSGQNGVEGNTQQAANLHTDNQHGYNGYDATGYYSQSGYNGQSAYGHGAYDQSGSNLHSASYGSNAQNRLVSGMPVKVVVRPGTRVIVPIATETYDSTNNAAYNHNSVSASNSVNQNSEAELISSQNNQNSIRPVGAKHYESAYSYHKEWEKHDTKPVTIVPVLTVPTASPFPKNSELYEDAQTLSTGQQYDSTGARSQSSHSQTNNMYSGYNANVNSASLSQTRQHSAYNNLHSSGSGSDSAASLQATHASGTGLDSTNQIEGVNSKPKSYHSSYSYHKSWERQGDPYIIKPASTGYAAQASQRLTSASSNQGAWSSHGYGSNYQQAHQNVLNLEDCDDHGNIRVARSYNTHQFEEQNPYQQSQYNYDQEALSQQSQNLEDLGQQAQSQWDQLDVGQQTQSQWDKLEDVAQQSQSHWDKVEELSQQSQNKWDKVEDLGQQTQNSFNKIEDLGQQTQNKFDKIEDLGQQTQNKFDKIEDLGQQTQNTFDKTEDLGQQEQNTFDKIEDLGQQSQNKWDKIEDLGQQTQTHWDQLEGAGQQTQSNWDNFGQQTQLDGQQLQNTRDQSESSSYIGIGQETHSNWDKLNKAEQGKSTESSFNNDESDSHKFKDLIPTTVQHPWNENVQVQRNNPYWEQSDKDNSPPSSYNNFNHPWFNPMPYGPQSKEQNSNSFNQQSQTYNAWSNHESSFSQSHSQNNWDQSFFNHGHTIDTSPQSTAQDSSTLWNLWNKVDTIEKQTISSKNSSVESETISEHNLNIPAIFTDIPSTLSTTSRPRMEATSISSPTTKDYKQLEDKKLQPADVGRGDIGPEDTDHTSKVGNESAEALNVFEPKPTTGDFVTTSDHKRYNNPADIEAGSQILVNDKPASAVTNNFNEKDNMNSQQEFEPTKPKLWISYPEFVIGEDGTHLVDKPATQRNVQNGHDFVQQIVEKEKNVDLVQQTHKISLQNGTSTDILHNNNFVQNSQTSDKQYQNMGQYNGNTATVQIGQSNIDQSYGQQSEYFDQQNSQQNSEKFNQENLQQFDSFGQPGNIPLPQNTNISKQDASTESIFPSNEQPQHPIDTGSFNIPVIIVTKPKPKENIITDRKPSHEFTTSNSGPLGLNNNYDNQQSNMQNAQQFESIDDLYQQHTGQELESFQQQSNNFDQQNTDQQFEGFEQQNGKEELNMEQQFETLTQQLDSFDTHNTEQEVVSLDTQDKEVTRLLETTFKTPVIVDTQQTEQQFEHLNENLEHPVAPAHQFENIGSERVGSYNKFRHTESFEQTNMGETEDLGQQVQTSWKPSNNQNERTYVQETQHLEITPANEPIFKSTLTEGNAHKPQIIVDTEPTTQHTSPIDTPPEMETEKPGFWKSVGNKFVSAKDKVFSWFGSG